MADTRIVYGVNCCWWDDISKVNKDHIIPTCPHCENPLFEMPNIEAWWKQVDGYDKENPGYRAFVEWLRGKCYPSYQVAQKAWRQDHGGVQ